MKKEVLDIEEVMERVQDDRELFMELLEIFQEDYAEKRKQLDGLIAQNDLAQIRDVAHSIKGASGNISAKSIEASCEIIERAAEEGNMLLIQETILLLDRQFAELHTIIVQLKEAPGTS